MVVVSKKQGETKDTLISRFNRQTREEDIKWDVERRKRHMRSSELLKAKRKKRQQRIAAQRRRRLSS
jgi:hypothetical protein